MARSADPLAHDLYEAYLAKARYRLVPAPGDIPVRKPQTSVFDGKGNESVVVFGEDLEGHPAQGTGPDAASAKVEVAEGDANDPGTDFGHPERD